MQCANAAPLSNATGTTNALHWQPLDEPGSGGAMVDIAVSPWDSRRVLVAGDMLGVGLSTDRGDSWQATSGFKTWEMASFTWHPTRQNEVWVGSMSGPYQSLDGGKTWNQKRVGMPTPASFGYSVPIEKVIFDPKNSAHLLALGGSSRHWDFTGNPLRGVIWESKNDGESWTRLVTITATGTSATEDKGENILWASFAPQSSTRLYALTDNAFWISLDGGKSWRQSMKGLPTATLERVALHPTNPNILWMSVYSFIAPGAKTRTPGGVYKSVDGGQTWKNHSQGLAQIVHVDDFNLTSYYRAIVVAPSNPNVLYTNDVSWSNGTSYKSEDGGATWKAVVSKSNIGIANEDAAKRSVFQLDTACPSGLGLAGITIDPRDANASYGFGTETIARSLDGGKTWNDATAQKVGNVFGKAWRGRGFAGWVSTNFRFNPYRKGQSIWQAMDAGRLWISDDDLKSWTRQLSEPDAWNGGRDVAFTRDGTIYATTGTYNFTGVARSRDGGATWTVLHGKARNLPEFYSGSAPGGIYAQPDNSKKVWVCVNGALMGSADGGETWNRVLDKPSLMWMASDPKKPSRFYVAGDRNIYMTDDGQNFTAIGGPHTHDVNMTVDNRGRLLVSATNSERNGLWRYDATLPEAARWTRLSDESTMGGVAVDPTNPNRVVFSTNQNPFTEVSAATGVWFSSNGGQSWSQQNDGLGMLRGNVLAFDPFNPERIVFGTYGRGFFQTTWPAIKSLNGARAYVSTRNDAQFATVRFSSAPQIALDNGDMEKGAALPEGWSKQWVGHGDIQVSRDTAVFHGGQASLHVESVGDSMGQAARLMDGASGSQFTLSGWVKSAGSAKVNVYVQSFNGNWNPVADNSFQQAAFVANTTDWTPFEKTIVLPAGVAHFGVGLLLDGNGEAWLDDVKITNLKLPKGES